MSCLLIETKRLCIQNLDVSDQQDFYAYRSNPEVTKFQGFYVFTWEQAGKFIDTNNKRNLAPRENGCSMELKTKIPANSLATVPLNSIRTIQELARSVLPFHQVISNKGMPKKPLRAFLIFCLTVMISTG